MADLLARMEAAKQRLQNVRQARGILFEDEIATLTEAIEELKRTKSAPERPALAVGEPIGCPTPGACSCPQTKKAGA